MSNIKDKEKHCIWNLEQLKQTKFCAAVSRLQTSPGGLCSQTFLLKSNSKALNYKVANVEPSESETEMFSILECVGIHSWNTELPDIPG